MIYFEESKWLYLAVLAALPFIRWRGERLSIYSHVALIPKDGLTLVFIFLKKIAASCAICALAVALAGPVSGGGEVTRIGTGSSIVFVLDMSGSMMFPMADDSKLTRWQLSEDVIARFVQKRCPKDRVGLIGFGSMSVTFSPLTYYCRNFIDVLKGRGVDLGGTVIGTPLQNAISMLYGLETSGKAIILVSDGDGDMKNMDDLAKWIKKYGIKFYWVSIGEDNAQNMQKFMAILGEGYSEKFKVTKAEDFDPAFAKIDKLERGLIRYQEFVPRYSWKPYVLKFLLAVLALSLFFAMFDFNLARALRRKRRNVK